MNTLRKRSTRKQLAMTGIALVLVTFAAAAHAAGIETLNHTARDLNYIAVEQPGKPDSGGHVCSVGIPDRWHPGLQVVVIYQLEPERSEYRRVLVDVPPYAGGKAGDTWLIVHADESRRGSGVELWPEPPGMAGAGQRISGADTRIPVETVGNKIGAGKGRAGDF